MNKWMNVFLRRLVIFTSNEWMNEWMYKWIDYLENHKVIKTINHTINQSMLHLFPPLNRRAEECCSEADFGVGRERPWPGVCHRPFGRRASPKCVSHSRQRHAQRTTRPSHRCQPGAYDEWEWCHRNASLIHVNAMLREQLDQATAANQVRAMMRQREKEREREREREGGFSHS